ncbi:MAG: PASTA domain-containing protein, partial [Planctomycetota bacterium]
MKGLSNLITLLVIAALTLLAGPASAVVYYVDSESPDDPNDGLSWNEAKPTIQWAVNLAEPGDEIWVKMGTYAISSQIQVNEAIGIYGGFAGSEIERSQRDWANNITTIDGQGTTGILSLIDEPTIDGFTLTNGYYTGLFGGAAVYIGGGASSQKNARVSNCIISNNTADPDQIGPEGYKGGGAIRVGLGDPIFTNCLIINNSTNAYGGAVNVYSGSPQFINCTISKNTALMGGGMCLQGGSGNPVVDAEFHNCIVWGNTGTTDANDLFIRVGGDPPQGSNNCSSVEIGSGTILADPLFIDPNSNDFHLQAASPCIDVGDSDSVPSDVSDLDDDGDPNEPVPLDLDGRARFINGTYADESPLPHADIGAYEFGELHCGNGDLPYPTGDINLDCGVDLIDSAMFTLCWLTNAGEPGWDPNCNLYDADLTIDIYDIDVLGENWLTFALYTPPEPVTVPDVVGMLQATAETAITAASLVVGDVTTSYDPNIPVGSVISQDPNAGSSVLPDTFVDLIVSLGPEPVTVPDVVGMLQATAEAAVTAAGLVVGSVTTSYDPNIPVGSVISQDPHAGSSVLPDTFVDLVVSLGTEP